MSGWSARDGCSGVAAQRGSVPVRLKASSWATAGALAVIALVVGACGGGDDEEQAVAEPPTTTTTVAETTTTTESPWTPEEQEVIDAHEAAVDASLEAAEGPKPDPDHPALEETYTDVRLGEEKSSLLAMERNGSAVRFPEDDEPVHEVTVHSVTFDEVDGVEVAYLEVCTVTNSEEFVVRTGEALTDSGGLRTVAGQVTYHYVDGTWKAAASDHQSTESGEVECEFD